MPAHEIGGAEALAMVETSPDGMILADGDGTILLVNAQVESLFGYDRENLVGQPVETLLPERHRQGHHAHRARYREQPRPRAMGSGLDLLAVRRDGSEFPVEVSLAPVQTAAGLRVVATVRDITERLVADSLNQAVRHGIDAVQDGVFMFTPDSLRFTYVNHGAIDQLGYARDELLAMTPVEIKPEYTEATFRQLLQPLLDGTVSSHVFTTRHRRKDGTDVPVEIVLEFPAATSEHQPRMLVALVRDITDRLRIQRALEVSEEAFRTAFDAAPVGIALVDFTDTVLRPISDCNQALCELLGYTKAELLTKSFATLTFAGDSERSDAAAQEAAAGIRTRYSMEKRYIHADGHPIWVWVHSAVLSDEAGNPTRGMVHVADLTSRKQAEAERERARETESKVALLEDRERLAEDLHDLVIQRLFASGMALQSVLPLAQEQAVSDRITQTVEQLDETISELRSAIFKLNSPQTDHVAEELNRIIENSVEPLGFRPELRLQGDPENIPGRILEQLYPTLVEALSNVARHADASAVSVQLIVEQQLVELRVVDNGAGVTAAPAHGHGLPNVEARARRVGGQAKLTNNAGPGATLTWSATR